VTREEATALAEAKWGAEAATWSPGAGRCVIGRWVPLAELVDGPRPIILRVRTLGVEVHGEAPTWEEAARAAGLLDVAEQLGIAAAAELADGASSRKNEP
jgi:hypothetical protein